MKKKTLFYILFSVFLLIGFYVMVFYNNPYIENHSKKYISEVQDFQFVSQYGDTITKKNITNKVVVANFFFVNCEGICPKMNATLHELYKKFSSTNRFLILSHTVEPERDNVAALKIYAQQYGIKNKNWLFLTGNKIDLYQQARQSYLLDDQNNNVGDIKDQFLHTQFVALVNKNAKVVAIYDTLLESELEQLKKDIQKLLEE